MARDGKIKDLMDYPALQQEAMRGLIRAALLRAAGPRGLPGDHHFFITFQTHAPGVTMPPELKARYPVEMTIVLQNQFWDLNPGDTAFSVTLQFGGQPKSLSIPYRAVTRFHDPSVQFALQFDPLIASDTSPPVSLAPVAAAKPAAPASEGPKIVSLDQFRKK